jgi:hypothetical protein
MSERYVKDGIVVCKRNHKNFKADKMYKITMVDVDSIQIDGVTFDFEKEKRNFFCSHICPSKRGCFEPSFDEVFYLLKETRRKKLKRLR